jgi:hypothetical protein
VDWKVGGKLWNQIRLDQKIVLSGLTIDNCWAPFVKELGFLGKANNIHRNFYAWRCVFVPSSLCVCPPFAFTWSSQVIWSWKSNRGKRGPVVNHFTIIFNVYHFTIISVSLTVQLDYLAWSKHLAPVSASAIYCFQIILNLWNYCVNF